jgi:hypothetical protein
VRDNKLIEIIKLFSPKEWKDFEKFVASPYFPRGRDVSGLHALLKKHYPDFSSDKLTNQKVFTGLFSGEKFNEKKLINIISDLTKLAEQFLIHNAIDSNEILAEETLARVYKEKKSDKLFLKTLNSLEKKLNNKKFQSVLCFNEEERFERLYEEYYMGIHKFDKSVPKRIKYTEYSILTFMVTFLRKQRDKHAIKRGYNILLDSPLISSIYEGLDLDKTIDLLKDRKSEWLWLIEIYYYMLRSMENLKDESLFIKFQELFYKNIDKLDRREKYFIFNDFISWIYAKDDEAGTVSDKEEFEIFKKMFEYNAYSASEEEYLSVMLYRNVMSLSISLKEFDWFENFIKDFTPKLKPEFRENMESLAQANLFFETGKFEEALKRIGTIPYDLYLYKIDIKNLMLRIYYELGLFESAFSMINAFRNFLSSTDEISEPFKNQHTNFLTFYNKLLKMKADEKFSESGFLEKEIMEKNPVAAKDWLIQKAQELKKKSSRK